MPEMLALPRYAIVKRQTAATTTNPDGHRAVTNSISGNPGEHAQFPPMKIIGADGLFQTPLNFRWASTLRDQLLDRQLGLIRGSRIEH